MRTGYTLETWVPEESSYGILNNPDYLYGKPFQGAQGPQSGYPTIYRSKEAAEEACNNVNAHLTRFGLSYRYQVAEVQVEE